MSSSSNTVLQKPTEHRIVIEHRPDMHDAWYRGLSWRQKEMKTFPDWHHEGIGPNAGHHILIYESDVKKAQQLQQFIESSDNLRERTVTIVSMRERGHELSPVITNDPTVWYFQFLEKARCLEALKETHEGRGRVVIFD